MHEFSQRKAKIGTYIADVTMLPSHISPLAQVNPVFELTCAEEVK